MSDFLFWVFELLLAVAAFGALYSKIKFGNFSEGFIRLWEKIKGDGFH